MAIPVKLTSNELVLKLKFEEEKTLGIIKKIIKGLVTPPDKYNKTVNPPNNPWIITGPKAEKVNFFNQRSLSIGWSN